MGAITEALPVSELIAGSALAAAPWAERCSEGSWSFGDDSTTLELAFLGPPQVAGLTSNDGSCVLHLRYGRHRFLLPGDISTGIEHRLASRLPGALSADVLVSAHHGSATSSSWAFLKHVGSRDVIHSSGYRNHFGHPAGSVSRRMAQLGMRQHVTADHGAIIVISDGYRLHVQRHREQILRYWD